MHSQYIPHTHTRLCADTIYHLPRLSGVIFKKKKKKIPALEAAILQNAAHSLVQNQHLVRANR